MSVLMYQFVTNGVINLLEAKRVCEWHRRLHQYNVGWQTKSAAANGNHVNKSNTNIDYCYCCGWCSWNEYKSSFVRNWRATRDAKMAMDYRYLHYREHTVVYYNYFFLQVQRIYIDQLRVLLSTIRDVINLNLALSKHQFHNISFYLYHWY